MTRSYQKGMSELIVRNKVKVSAKTKLLHIKSDSCKLSCNSLSLSEARAISFPILNYCYCKVEITI